MQVVGVYLYREGAGKVFEFEQERFVRPSR
jgi:hypothetical protein